MPHVFAPDHVDESKPQLVQTAKRQQRRPKIRRQRMMSSGNFDHIALPRVNQAKAGFDRGRIGRTTEVHGRRHRNPVTAGRLKPWWRPTGGKAMVDTYERSSKPR